MRDRMWRFATLTCMQCGDIAANIWDGRLELAPGTVRTGDWRTLRCPRCKGPTYLEREVEPASLPELAPLPLARTRLR